MKASWVFSAVVIVGLSIAGCGGDKTTGGTSAGESNGKSAINEEDLGPILRTAINMLGSLEQFDEKPAMDEVVQRLNSWVRPQELTVVWKPDPKIDTLPEALQTGAWLEHLPDQTFDRSLDGSFLKEAVWMRDISKSASGSSLDDDLVKAERLFDWTIRNIQLVVEPRVKQGEFNAAAELIARHLPPDILLYGRGTAQQRAWIFILLARQQGMDVVMLATPDPDDTKKLRPWLPALLHKGNLYLFDPALGLPIPGPGGKGIATLAEAVDDPSVLNRLDLDESHHYPVKSAEAKQVVALLEASPGYLARRMKILEGKLVGMEDMKLTTVPTKVAEQLKGIKYLSPDVRLWPLPFETLALRVADEDPNLVQNAAQAERRKLLLKYQAEEMAPFLLPGRRPPGVAPGVQQASLDRMMREGDSIVRRERVGIASKWDDAHPPAVIVTNVAPDSPAQAAGLEPGNRITKLNGKSFSSNEEFQKMLLSEPEARLKLIVESGDQVRHPEVLRLRSEFEAPREKPVTRVGKFYFPLWAGRLLQFAGKWDGDSGSKHYFIIARPGDDQMEEIVKELAENYVETEHKPPPIAEYQRAVLRRKQDATYWLGLISFEEKAWSPAEDYFRKLTLDVWANGPWTNGARYNLARTYEAAGRTADAIRAYEEDDSPQRHGNRLRAQWLKEKMKGGAGVR